MSLSKAQKFFEEQNYVATINECVSLIKRNENIREACILAAKADLYVLKTPAAVNEADVFYDSAKTAIAHCTTVEELYETSYEIRSEIANWYPTVINNALEKLESNPCIEAYKEYIPVKVDYAKTNVLIFMALIREDRNQMLENEGLESDEADKLYHKNVEEILSKDDIKILEFESAQRIFTNIRTYVHNNSVGDINVANVATNALLMLDCMMSVAEETSETFSDNDALPLLQFHAQVLTYLMNTTINVNAQLISIYQGDRAQTYRDIDNLYRKIKNIDGSFIAPTLPDITAIKPASSGGCYVATAVYGSYDCPEVWTLRRYRDYTLDETWYGKAFIKTYYAISPTLVKWFGETNWFKNFWRKRLDRLVEKLQNKGIESTQYSDKY